MWGPSGRLWELPNNLGRSFTPHGFPSHCGRKITPLREEKAEPPLGSLAQVSGQGLRPPARGGGRGEFWGGGRCTLRLLGQFASVGSAVPLLAQWQRGWAGGRDTRLALTATSRLKT